MLDGASELLTSDRQVAQQVMRFRVAGIEPQGMLEMSHGLGERPPAAGNLSQTDIGGCGLGLQRQRLPIVGFGFRLPADLQQRAGKLQVRPGAPGGSFRQRLQTIDVPRHRRPVSPQRRGQNHWRPLPQHLESGRALGELPCRPAFAPPLRRYCLQGPGRLDHLENLVRRHRGYLLPYPRRPADGNMVDAVVLSEAEEQTWIALGEIAAGAPRLGDLDALTRSHLDSRAVPVAVALRTLQAQGEPPVADRSWRPRSRSPSQHLPVPSLRNSWSPCPYAACVERPMFSSM